MTVRIVSDDELSRLGMLRDLDHRRLSAATAAEILGLGNRQILRLLKADRLRSADGLISKQRGRPSNRYKPEDIRAEALAIITARYADSRPTLVAEKLHELHGMGLGRETVRAWMGNRVTFSMRETCFYHAGLSPSGHPLLFFSVDVRQDAVKQILRLP